MKMPNGYGSVYKLKGNRRRPWCIRVTERWDIVPGQDKVRPVYKYLGYYATKREALQVLAEWNANPYQISDMTLEELFVKWSKVHFERISDSNIKGVNAAWRLCEPIRNMPISDIKLDIIQTIADESGKNTPTLKKYKSMLGMMYDFAVAHEYVNPSRREVIRHLDVSKFGNPKSFSRAPFSEAEIELLWKVQSGNEYVSVVLMLIYTGCRIGELLNLRVEDIHLEERWFFVKESKTAAGIREVPIAEKIVPFFEYWLSRESTHLICMADGSPFTYRNYYDSYWKPIMDKLNFNHRPHDTRHTTITLLTQANVDDRLIKQIVGHAGQGVTQQVYTHLSIQPKLDAINLL